MADATLSAASLRVVKLLVGNPPQAISDLAKTIGVTRTAVSEQLDELISAGFVERSIENRAIRGRPRHLYKATQAALLLLFPGNQQLIVPAIWQSINEIGGRDLTEKVLESVSRAVAKHYSDKISVKRPKERLRQLINLLMAEGGVVETVEDDEGQLLLHKRSCPFVSMVDSHRSVCRIDQSMLSAVVGKPVRRTACRLEGAPCCTFVIDE